ncbi:hypothetical protein OO17_05165 [Rhodopseudomonas palustris]|uniref:LysM domain-containing protein n=1 Tax=Rhodopseudomonas palustris TaxID=1076 RepID=A0A0D7F3C7_RHOPL|nr:hypothetical protein OO17_05165 [Rhodopseudomonas palustris]
MLQPGVPLYLADGATPLTAPTLYYVLVGDPAQFPSMLTADTAWSDYSGGFVFVAPGASVADAKATVAAVNARLQPQSPGLQWLVWADDPNPAAIAKAQILTIAKSLGAGSGRIKGNSAVTFVNLSLQISAELEVAPSFDGTPPGLSLIPNVSGASGLVLQRQGAGQASLALPNDRPVLIPFAGASLGAFSFGFAPDRGSFFALFAPEDDSESPPASAEIRYFCGAASAPTRLRFPVMLGSFPDPRAPIAAQLPMLVTIDPLRPTDCVRTRFAFDLSQYGGTGPVLPVSAALRSTAGAALYLQPQSDAGFGLALRPGAGATQAAYLTPAGRYQLTRTPLLDVAAQTPIANDPLALMCGIFGSEFLLLADHDLLDFQGTRPAYATRYPPLDTPVEPGQGDTALLSDAFTTNWIQVIPGPDSATTFPGYIKQSFCAQAVDTVYYQSAAPSGEPFPIAVGARIADLSQVAAGQILPLAPYGYVYYSDQSIANPNPDIVAATFTGFETAVLSPARFDAVAADRCLGPLFFDMATLEALSGGFVQTPQGLLVGLNAGAMESATPAGSWQQLLLARSPQIPAQLLRFMHGTTPSSCPGGVGPFDVVSPYLSTALMNPSAFLVAADPTYLGAFDNVLQLGEYPIEIAVSNADTGPRLDLNCVLVFKLAKGRSFVELAADPSGWTDPDLFVGVGRAATISAQILAYIKQAQANSDEARATGGYDYFADFLARVTDVNWTGILALDAPLQLQHLPPDIAMLLCGMRSSKPLCCHHFGITTNAPKQAATVEETLQHSSLFGLIYYDYGFETPTTALDFQTLSLKALFANSLIKQFESRIAYSLAALFGDPTKLTVAGQNDFPATNTIVIDGALQLRDGQTSVVFVTSEQRVFSFPVDGGAYRALAALTVDSAGLAPVSESQDAGATTLIAGFTLDGALGFTTQPGISPVPIDLFSYGLDADYAGGLGYTGYGFRLLSQIPAQGLTPPPAIALHLDGLLLDPAASTPRQQSLMATLPLKMLGFSQAPDQAALKAVLVTGTGLDGVSPSFAIELQVMMGTMGALTTAAPLDGRLMLGWVPGATTAQSDKVGLLLAPPASMHDGTFHLQGVLPTQYGAVELLRPLLDKSYVYVLVLRNVLFALGAFPLYIPSTGERSLTFFGIPGGEGGDEGDGGVNLAWFFGEPDLSTPPAQAQLSTTTPALSVVPAVYVVAGIKVNYDVQSNDVIPIIINMLSQVPLSTKAALDDIVAGSVMIPVSYDPAAGVTVAVDLEFTPVSFQFVFSDPFVYGARLSIAAEPEPPKPTSAGGAVLRVDDEPPKKKGILSSLRGFVLEIAYRRISDNLGAWSGSFTWTKPIGTDDYQILLPTVGLIIYTNNDFRIDIGWPFTPDGIGLTQPFAVQFSIEGVPLRAAGGLYLAKLRSADAPGELGDNFAIIWRFGLGLSFGINKDFQKGPMSLNAGLIAFVTFEGFLASTHGTLDEAGVEYKWFAGQLGLEAYFSGSIDLKIISASISISATLVLQVAYETAHTTIIRFAFRVSIYVSFHIVFIRISFSFDADIDVLPPLKIGSGPPAQMFGPTPITARMVESRPQPVLAPRLRKQIHPQVAARFAAADVAAAPVELTLYFTVQPAVINSTSAAAPQAVAGLAIQLEPESQDPDDFANLVTSLAQYLLQAYGAGTTLTEQLAAITLRLDDGTFDGAVGDFLSSLKFKILPQANLTEAADFAFFPMLPQLALSYNGAQIAFDAPPLPADYAEQLQKYFNQLAQGLQLHQAAMKAAATSDFPTSAAGLVCGDMIVLLAKQLISNLDDIAEADPDLSFDEALTLLGPAGFAKLAGFMSRFALYGLRLPVPGSVPFGSELTGVYQLTGQQVALAQQSGKWITGFTLGYAPGQGAAASWIVFGADGKGQSVADDLGAGLVLDTMVQPSWLGAGGGFVALPPLATQPCPFYLPRTYAWTKADSQVGNLRPISDVLMSRLALFYAGGGSGAVAALAQLPGDAAPIALAASAALLVPLGLRRIVPQGQSTPLSNVFRLIGTDDSTRELLDELIDAGAASGATLTMLLGSGASSYATATKQDAIVLAKANLSTLNEPPTLMADATPMLRAAAALPPSSATLADADAFAQLVWEVSVVNADGFYLHIDDVPDDAFRNGDAQIALLAQFAPVGATSALQPWSNCFVLDAVPDNAKGAVAATVSDASGDWVTTTPASLAGSVGFSIDWPAPPATPGLGATPTPQQQAAYAEALYSLLQYRVVSIEAATPRVAALVGGAVSLPTNWSLPIGPNQAERDADWIFTNSVAVAALLGQSNRYAGIGATVGFSIQLLDIYGNALPGDNNLGVPFVYNDALLGVEAWPGLRSYYAFAAGSGDVAMTLQLTFNPADLGAGALSADDPVALGDALGAYQQIYDQLSDPLQVGNPGAAIQLETILSAAPLAQTKDGEALRAVLTAYVQTIIGYLVSAIAGNKPPVPDPLLAEFSLQKDYVGQLPSDIFELTVDLVFARAADTVVPAIAAAMPGVERINSRIAAAVSLATQGATTDGPDMQLSAFAQAFESAWYGFDGGSTQLKLAEGVAASNAQARAKRVAKLGAVRAAAVDAAPTKALAPLWCVRVGAGAGIAVTFPNAAATPAAADLPLCCSPLPLSTILITEIVKVRVYAATWTGTGRDVIADQDHLFTGIDMDVWGAQFLAAVDAVFEPLMATATATLDAARYADLAANKQSLADQIATGLAAVLQIPGQSAQIGDAVERFRQALLQTLTTDYALASVVQIPATVALAGTDEPSAPPQLFGKVSDPSLSAAARQAFTLSSANLTLADGAEPLIYLASARNPAAAAYLDLHTDYDVSFLEHDFEPDRKRYGYEPSSWLSFIVPAYLPADTAKPALNFATGRNAIPVPLRSYPAMPVISSQAVAVSSDIVSIAEALLWAYSFTVSAPSAAQDELTLLVLLNDPPLAGQMARATRSLHANVGGDDPPRPPPADLFEALARFAFEYPQISPHLAEVPAAAFDGADPVVPRKALQRFDELIGGVALTWASWIAGHLGARATRLTKRLQRATTTASVPRATWRYVVDFSTRPDLTVTRSIDESGTLPPWPSIEGYTTPSGSESKAVYKRIGSGEVPASLAFALAELFMVAGQSAHVMANVVRNANLVPPGMPAGTSVDPGFVYTTPWTELKDPIGPALEVTTPIIVGSGAATLSAAVDLLLQPFVDGPPVPGVEAATMRLLVNGGYAYTLADGGPDQQLLSRSAIFLADQQIALTVAPSDPASLATFKQDLVTALRDWQASFDPSQSGAFIGLLLTLFTQTSDQQVALSRLDDVRIPVPDGQPGWWTG